jgi:hypothetical protein
VSYAPSPELRECCILAMNGDHDAARSILNLWGYPQIAREVRDGKPFSNRVRRAIDCLTAGVGSGFDLDGWEVRNDDGSIEVLTITPPPPPGAARRANKFDD